MKLFSQNGFGEGKKVVEGLQSRSISGVILSPRDTPKAQLLKKAEEYSSANPQAEVLFDPQYYAALGLEGESRLGNLLEDYTDYFTLRRRSSLERESAVIEALKSTLAFQMQMPFVSSVIAPNIIISKSLDSVEALISKNFIRLAHDAYRTLNGTKPLLATLAVSREALEKDDFLEFVNEITGLDSPPDGFYLLLGARNTEDRSEIFNPKVLAYWMYLNHVLANVNGATVVNGFSDLAMPALLISGASAGATGWWSNLRAFSLSRFEAAGSGGRLPTPRYLSIRLLNRISFAELDQLRITLPSVLNGLETDNEYPIENGSEPQRNREILQTWEALRNLSDRLESTDMLESIEKLRNMVSDARECYDRIQSMGMRLEPKSGPEHLDAIVESIQIFKKLAEITP